MQESGLPMLSVTVMMLRLIVESVILLKDEDWKGRKRIITLTSTWHEVNINQPSQLFLILNVNFTRNSDVSLRGSPGLFWPLCASVGGACVCASAARKNFVLRSHWAWNTEEDRGNSEYKAEIWRGRKRAQCIRITLQSLSINPDCSIRQKNNESFQSLY